MQTRVPAKKAESTEEYSIPRVSLGQDFRSGSRAEELAVSTTRPLPSLADVVVARDFFGKGPEADMASLTYHLVNTRTAPLTGSPADDIPACRPAPRAGTARSAD